MRIVLWQDMLAFIQEAHISALAEVHGHEVVWVTAEEVAARRVAGGWRKAEVQGVEVITAPDDATIERLLTERPEESVHIVGGLTRFPFADRVVPAANRLGLRWGILQENRPSKGLKASARRLLYMQERLRRGRSADFLLVMGYGGPYGGRRFYRSVGWRDSKLYPYGYFGRFRDDPPPPRPDGPFRFAFAGVCTDRKGGDLLLRALGRLTRQPWTLDVIGDGVRRTDWEALAVDAGIADRVTFHGVLPNDDAQEIIGRADLLVLPSRFDGWGFVVNEALGHGVPVLCSDRCGASDLLGDAWRGGTFPAFDVDPLAAALRERLDDGPADDAQRRRIWEWTRRADGEAAAAHLLACLRHASEGGSPPIPPWVATAENERQRSGNGSR